MPTDTCNDTAAPLRALIHRQSTLRSRETSALALIASLGRDAVIVGTLTASTGGGFVQLDNATAQRMAHEQLDAVRRELDVVNERVAAISTLLSS